MDSAKAEIDWYWFRCCDMFDEHEKRYLSCTPFEQKVRETLWYGYINSNKQKVGPWCCVHVDGMITKGSYFDGQKEGLWITTNELGEVLCTGAFHQGLKEGKWISFHPNGNKETEVHFYRNKRERQVTYDEEGKILNAEEM